MDAIASLLDRRYQFQVRARLDQLKPVRLEQWRDRHDRFAKLFPRIVPRLIRVTMAEGIPTAFPRELICLPARRPTSRRARLLEYRCGGPLKMKKVRRVPR